MLLGHSFRPLFKCGGYGGDCGEDNGCIHGRTVAQMRMIFIFLGRVVLSVSQSKIYPCAQLKELRTVRTADSQPDGERQVEK